MPTISKSKKMRQQRDILRKYRSLIPFSNIELALEIGVSPESVSRAINGVGTHLGVLKYIKEILEEVPEFENGMPTDLRTFLNSIDESY